jgi:tetratricopeptide (TPR) repeat protein
VLRAAPVIPGLTDALQNLSETKWRQALSKLRRIKLLTEPSRNSQRAPGTADELDAHPLVREHFGQQLRRRLPDAWREANNRLYEHLTRTAKELPETMEEMSPLFAAVAHGCAAGRHQEALDDVFQQRIQRGNPPFSVVRLGAFGANLAALAGFFAAPWQQPVAELTESDQAFVLNAAGFCLRALGQLKEAAQPLRASLEMCISLEDWKEAAIRVGNLSEIYLTLGEVAQALAFAQQSVELADRSGNGFERLKQRAKLADVLHQAGSDGRKPRPPSVRRKRYKRSGGPLIRSSTHCRDFGTANCCWDRAGCGKCATARRRRLRLPNANTGCSTSHWTIFRWGAPVCG